MWLFETAVLTVFTVFCYGYIIYVNDSRKAGVASFLESYITMALVMGVIIVGCDLANNVFEANSDKDNVISKWVQQYNSAVVK